MKYEIIIAPSASDLVEGVNAHLARGYLTLGGVSMSPGGTYGTQWAQSMILYEREDTTTVDDAT
jgi:hypothetical protein